MPPRRKLVAFTVPFLCSFARIHRVGSETVQSKRNIFIFYTKNMSQWIVIIFFRNIVAFRSQLPRANRFYNYEPPNDEIPQAEIKSPVRLCEVCGIRGPFSCSNCKEVSYCSSGHQKIDWMNGHKNKCKKSVTVSCSLFEMFVGIMWINIDSSVFTLLYAATSKRKSYIFAARIRA